MGIFSWLTGSEKNKGELIKDVFADMFQRQSDFECGKTTSFQIGNFHFAIDKEKNLIILNHSIEIRPHEFAWCKYDKTTHHSSTGGGSMQTVFTSTGMGSVYIPGPVTGGGSSTKCSQLKIIRLTESQAMFLAELSRVDAKLYHSVMKEVHVGNGDLAVKYSKQLLPNIDLDVMVLGDAGGKVECVAEIDMMGRDDGLIRFIDLTAIWCERSAAQYYYDRAQIELGEICVKAGLNENYIKLASGNWYFAAMEEGIAVDRSGKMVVLTNYGAETWIGTLKGASAKIVDLSTANEKKYKLDVKVDDPAYRAENMTERHFVILGSQPYEVLVEWEERINLLAKNAVAVAP